MEDLENGKSKPEATVCWDACGISLTVEEKTVDTIHCLSQYAIVLFMVVCAVVYFGIIICSVLYFLLA